MTYGSAAIAITSSQWRCVGVSLSIGFRDDYTLFRERRPLQEIAHKGIRYLPSKAFSCKLPYTEGVMINRHVPSFSVR